eukprot:gene7535-11859_t
MKNHSSIKKSKKKPNEQEKSIYQQITESIKSKSSGELISAISIPKEFLDLKPFQIVDSCFSKYYFFILTSNNMITVFDIKKFEAKKQIELNLKSEMSNCIAYFQTLSDPFTLLVGFENGKILMVKEDNFEQKEIDFSNENINSSVDYIIQVGNKLWVLIEEPEILVLNNFQFENRINTKKILEFIQPTTEYIWCIFDKTIQILDPLDYAVLMEIEMDSKISNITYSNNTIITISISGILNQFDEFSFENIRSIKISKSPINSIASNMKELWVYDFDKTIQIFNILDFTLMKMMKGLNYSIEEMCLIQDVFDENSTLLWSICNDKKVRVWKGNGKIIEKIENYESEKDFEPFNFDDLKLEFEDDPFEESEKEDEIKEENQLKLEMKLDQEPLKEKQELENLKEMNDLEISMNEPFQEKIDFTNETLLEKYEDEIESLRIQLQNSINGLNKYKFKNNQNITTETQTDLTSTEINQQKEKFEIYRLEMINYQNDLDQTIHAFNFLLSDLTKIKEEKEEMNDILEFKENEILTLKSLNSKIKSNEDEEDFQELLIEESQKNLELEKRIIEIKKQNENLTQKNEILLNESKELKTKIKFIASNLNISNFENKNMNDLIGEIQSTVQDEKVHFSNQIQKLLEKVDQFIHLKE